MQENIKQEPTIKKIHLTNLLKKNYNLDPGKVSRTVWYDGKGEKHIDKKIIDGDFIIAANLITDNKFEIEFAHYNNDIDAIVQDLIKNGYKAKRYGNSKIEIDGYAQLTERYNIFIVSEDGPNIYNSHKVDTVDSLEQAEDRVAELSAETGCGAYYEEDNKLDEEATQASAVDGGIVSVFGSNGGNKFDEDNWYKQLFELNDMEETTIQDQYKVASSKVENTGGGTLIEFGRFENGLYYGLNEETLVIYNDDYHQAYLNQDEEDFYQWQEDHIINAFDPDDMEYSIVAGQSKQFKPEIKVYECMDCGKEFENPREGACPYCGSGDIAE